MELTKKEQYDLEKKRREEERKKSKRIDAAKKWGKIGFLAVIFFFIVGLGIRYISKNISSSPSDSTQLCIQHRGVGMHIHPHLRIVIHGEEVKIPTNIGITPDCMQPIHTHDETGTIHLEFPTWQDVKLVSFFRVWGKTFNRDCIFDKCNGEEGKVKMLVNGRENFEFENYVMRDGDDIVIIFEK